MWCSPLQGCPQFQICLQINNQVQWLQEMLRLPCSGSEVRNFFGKWPDREHCWLCEARRLNCNHSTLPLWHESSQYVNTRARLCSRKTLFLNTGYLAHGLVCRPFFLMEQKIVFGGKIRRLMTLESKSETEDCTLKCEEVLGLSQLIYCNYIFPCVYLYE